MKIIVTPDEDGQNGVETDVHELLGNVSMGTLAVLEAASKSDGRKAVTRGSIKRMFRSMLDREVAHSEAWKAEHATELAAFDAWAAENPEQPITEWDGLQPLDYPGIDADDHLDDPEFLRNVPGLIFLAWRHDGGKQSFQDALDVPLSRWGFRTYQDVDDEDDDPVEDGHPKDDAGALDDQTAPSL